eukprot:COSAG01_NODE_6679_length_3547_cov_4.002320_3_plen_68_part_00
MSATPPASTPPSSWSKALPSMLRRRSPPAPPRVRGQHLHQPLPETTPTVSHRAPDIRRFAGSTLFGN